MSLEVTVAPFVFAVRRAEHIVHSAQSDPYRAVSGSALAEEVRVLIFVRGQLKHIKIFSILLS